MDEKQELNIAEVEQIVGRLFIQNWFLTKKLAEKHPAQMDMKEQTKMKVA